MLYPIQTSLNIHDRSRCFIKHVMICIGVSLACKSRKITPKMAEGQARIATNFNQREVEEIAETN